MRGRERAGSEAESLKAEREKHVEIKGQKVENLTSVHSTGATFKPPLKLMSHDGYRMGSTL